MLAQYLILHKVRGEPAFDIAEEIAPEMWIIPTSGHRAYPYKMWDLTSLEGDLGHDYFEAVSWVPPDWPDHYAVNDVRPKAQDTPLAEAILALNLTTEEFDSVLAEVLENRK